MSFAIVWLVVVIAASWAGWLLSCRVEAATLFMGIGIVVLAAIELLMTPIGRGLRRMPAAMLSVGVGLVFAAVFDRLDINRSGPQLDWLTGFLTGALLSGLPLLPVALRDRRSAHSFRPGDLPQPQWDAAWVSIGVAACGVAYLAHSRWHALRGEVIDDTARIATVVLVWLLVCALVQLSRFGRVYVGRLLAGVLGSAVMVVLVESTPVVFFVGLPFGYFLLAASGGTYALRRPSGTLDEGWYLLRHCTLGCALAFVIAVNIEGSLFNRTVSELVARHDALAPILEDSFTRLVERDAYLWYDELSKTPSERVRGKDKLYLAERDRFSTMWRKVGEKAKSAGKDGRIEPLYDPGVVLTRRDGLTFVAHVLAGSPAERAGVKRGWQVSLIRAADGVTTQFRFDGPAGREQVVTARHEDKAGVEFKIERMDERQVGYLYLDEFRVEALRPINAAFTAMQEAGVKDLVIDLRYNPGGVVWLAGHLSSLIAGNTHAGKEQFRLSHNVKYTDADYYARFRRLPQGADLQRVFVLQSRDTCSASELLVVALRPYLPVINIGEVSCGKPVGMSPLEFGDLRYMILNFRVSDAKGLGYFNEGLVPDCLMKDDLAQSFRPGSRGDPMFDAATVYMATGRCG